MKGLSRKKFSQVGRRLGDWFSAASHSRLPERVNHRCHASSRVAQLTEIHSTLITLAANPLNTPEVAQL
jgi:hypothetical protein